MSELYLEVLEPFLPQKFDTMVEEVEDEEGEDDLKEHHNVAEASYITRQTEHLKT